MNRGITIIEVFIALIIVAVAAAIVIPHFLSNQDANALEVRDLIRVYHGESVQQVGDYVFLLHGKKTESSKYPDRLFARRNGKLVQVLQADSLSYTETGIVSTNFGSIEIVIRPRYSGGE